MYFQGWIAAIAAIGAGSLFLVSPVSAANPQPNLTNVIAQKVQKITETQIRQILEQIRAAAKNRNASAIAKFMSPKVAIELTVQSASGSQTIRLSRDEYISYLQQGFAMRESYNTSYSNINIKIAPDGKSAIATFNVTEEVSLGEQTIQSTSSETVKFELMQGQILATSLKAVSRLE